MSGCLHSALEHMNLQRRNRSARYKLVNRCSHNFGSGVVRHVSNVLEQNKLCARQSRCEGACVDFPLLGFKPPSSDGDWLQP
jgi:hypothetical protein